MLQRTFLYSMIFMLASCQAMGPGPRPEPTEPTRSIPGCLTCPAGFVPFCNLCATNMVVDNLTVADSLTLCPSVTLPCFCCYNDSLTWGADEMHSDLSGPNNPDVFFPYFLNPDPFLQNFALRGWEIEPSFTAEADHITMQFEVPRDLDATVDPEFVIHFFYPSSIAVASAVRFRVDVQLLNDNQTLLPISSPTFTINSAAVIVTTPPTGFTHYRVAIPLTGLGAFLFVQDLQFAAITISRVPNGVPGEVEADSVFIAAAALNYRKLQCPLLIVPQ